MRKEFLEAAEASPVIAAVKDAEGLRESLKTDTGIVFILFGDILTIADLVDEVKESGKLAFVHIDLIAGLNAKEISVDFIRLKTRADGIITTKPPLIKRAKELGLFTILRFFVIDSKAYENISRQCEQARPDCIEILPGLMPKVIARIAKSERIPLIAGGLIADKEDILAALAAGAVSISTTDKAVWYL